VTDLEALSRPSLVVISPNQAGRRSHTLGVVIHSTRGGVDDAGDYARTIGWFSSPQSGVSAHRVIGRLSNEHCQMVADDNIAYHAGEHNAEWCGIEFCQEMSDTPFSSWQLETGARVVACWFKRWGIVPSADTIRAHSEMPQGIRQGKTDPGSLFPMAVFIARVKHLMEEAS
jgi:N-acetyl-anhydromuramyl-L-alanine amidase AmpD